MFSCPRWLLVSIAVLAASSGCGGSNSNIVKVSGQLTYKGQPIPGVYLRFEPDDLNTKSTSMAMTDAAGKFEMLLGSTPGVYKGQVKVLCDDPLAAVGGKTAVPKEVEPAYRELCAKYGHGKSTYMLTIEKSEPDMKLDLN
jgi:hypothetical protein